MGLDRGDGFLFCCNKYKLAVICSRMQSPLSIGLIGCGLRGVWYLRSFREAKLPMRLVAVADPDVHYAELASKLFGERKARIFSQGEEMLDAMPDLDGVIIASPNHAHRGAAVCAMQ